MIEPGIRSMIESYFKDWQTLEMEVTSLMMKHKGIFTTQQIVISLDEDETDSPLVTSIKDYWKIKRTMFGVKIQYLLDNKIISQTMYDLLSTLAKRRNRVHEYNGVITEDDRILFAAGASLLHPTYLSRCFEAEKEVWDYSIEINENASKQLLKGIGDWESSGSVGSMFKEAINIDKVKGGWELTK